MQERGCAVAIGALALVISALLAWLVVMVVTHDNPEFYTAGKWVQMVLAPVAPAALGVLLIVYGRRKDDAD